MQQSPLNHCLPNQDKFLIDKEELVIQELDLHSHINLRGNSDEPLFLQSVAKVLGFELSVEANRWTGNENCYACWLGPNEWLIVTTANDEDLAEKLRDACKTVFAAVTVVSGGQTLVRLSGSKARELLSKGCTLDFHPRVFTVGQCAQSLLGKAPMLIRQLDEQPLYEIVIRRSFADYLGLWLIDASEEYC